MRLITLTLNDGSKVFINADRIDGIMADGRGYSNIYVGGSENPFGVKESPDEVKLMCEPCHYVTKRIDPRDSGPRLNIDEMY